MTAVDTPHPPDTQQGAEPAARPDPAPDRTLPTSRPSAAPTAVPATGTPTTAARTAPPRVVTTAVPARTRPPSPTPATAVGPGIGRRLRRMRIGGTPAPSGRDAAAVLDAAFDAAAGRPAPEPEPALPDPTALVCRVVRAAVEVLRGERPAAQLARWVTPQVHDQLLERGRLMREARRTEPPRPRAHPATVRRVRTVRLGTTSAEATVILHDEGRVRAAAVRLEGRRGTWRVAVLEIG